MVDGAGTHEGYVEPDRDSVLRRIRRTVPTWVRVSTAHECPPFAWRTVEREP